MKIGQVMEKSYDLKKFAKYIIIYNKILLNFKIEIF